MDELLSVASEYLIRAVDRFDAARGFAFSTYATRSMRNGLLQFRSRRASGALGTAEDDTFDPPARESEYGTADLCDLRTAIRSTAKLNPRERAVIARCAGRGRLPMTNAEIASDMGISIHLVGRIRASAMTKLRNVLTPA